MTRSHVSFAYQGGKRNASVVGGSNGVEEGVTVCQTGESRSSRVCVDTRDFSLLIRRLIRANW